MLEIQQPCRGELDWEMKNTYMSPAGATRQVVIMSMHVPTIRLGQRRECASRSRGPQMFYYCCCMVGIRLDQGLCLLYERLRVRGLMSDVRGL